MLLVVYSHVIGCSQPCCLLFTAILFVVYSHVVCCLQPCCLEPCCLLFTSMLFVVYSDVVCCSHRCCLLFTAMLFVVHIHVVCCLQPFGLEPCRLLFTAMLFVVYSHVVCCLHLCCLLFTPCCLLFTSMLFVVYAMFAVHSHAACCLQPCCLLFPAMLFATILMSLTAMTLSQTPYIDYLTCSWQYAAEGSDAQCESGYIAIGACGSETSSDCNTNAAGVQCCRIKGEYYAAMQSQKAVSAYYFTSKQILPLQSSVGLYFIRQGKIVQNENFSINVNAILNHFLLKFRIGPLYIVFSNHLASTLHLSSVVNQIV